MTVLAAVRRGHWRGRRWRIAVLFIVGSSLFALGAVPFYSEAVGLRATALTFFVGSVFFTAAAFGQYRETVDGLSTANTGRRRFWVWAPRDLAWLACAVQLAGTLWFNWSTANALRLNLIAASADERVWRPDALGSVAFLVASGLSWIDAVGGGDGRARTRDWWIGAANMLGSIAFGVSAVAAYVVPATGDVWNDELSNLGTLLGAVCFLVGAIMLLPSATRTTPGMITAG